MPKGYRNGFNPYRSSDGTYATQSGANRPSTDPRRHTQAVYRSRDGRQTITKDSRGGMSLKRDGRMTGASITPKRSGGYVFTQPNGRTTFKREIPTQAKAL